MIRTHETKVLTRSVSSEVAHIRPEGPIQLRLYRPFRPETLYSHKGPVAHATG